MCSDRSWVARIDGLDPKYGYIREFVLKVGNGRFTRLEIGRIYEYARVHTYGASNYQYQKGNHNRGFFIHTGTELIELTRTEVERRMLAASEKPEPVKMGSI